MDERTARMSPAGRLRITGLLLALVLLGLVTLDVPNHFLSRWAYAVQRGRFQADMEELARVDEVARAFRLVARVARTGVVNIQVRPNGDEFAVWRREIGELTDERDRVTEELEGALRAGDESEQERLAVRLERIGRQLRRLFERIQESTGSGVIYDRDGHVLTNNHVVDAPGDIMVRLADDREYRARLVGRDPQSDLALLRIDESEVQPLSFADSDAIEVGDWVLAVGAPFGLDYTVTHGILSARGRTNVATGAGIVYRDFLQTDAAINPGNSGGPLLNIRGEVVGINTAIATNETGVNAGVAFAIPANLAVKIAEKLKSDGEVVRGWLGVSMDPLERADRELLGITGAVGVMVSAVIRGSPAEDAGLQPQDIVLAIDGHPVGTPDEMLATIGDILPGEVAQIQVQRGAERRTFGITLARRSEALLRTEPGFRERSLPLPGLEVFVRTQLPSQSQLLPSALGAGGAQVSAVSTDLPLDVNEVIVAIDGQAVRTAHEAIERIGRASGRVRLTLVDRDGEQRTEVVELSR